ncbi:hypothetical protein PR048_005663 [Dryococelus australis]|uniref:Metallothionein n=1 Tax=Dryococelus australis TaxID=614101 RepID=A0ABQ9IA13_9NEOP|nr:hypothetical protein PR048_005663 [Dryococelus australis]
MTLLPPAPDVLLNTSVCNCTKGCGTNCGCRKVGLPCSIVCGHCRGKTYLNPTTDSVSSDDSDEISIKTTQYDEINPSNYLTSKLSEEGVNEEDEGKEVLEVEDDEEKDVPEVENDDEKES